MSDFFPVMNIKSGSSEANVTFTKIVLFSCRELSIYLILNKITVNPLEFK